MKKKSLKLCTICCKDHILKQMVKENSDGAGECTFCGCKRQAVVEILTNRKILNVIRALIKYHNEIYDYLWRGQYRYKNNVSKLLLKRNAIFNENVTKCFLKHKSENTIKTIFRAIKNPEKPHIGVSLQPQTKWINRNRVIIDPEPIPKRSSQYLNEICMKIQKDNYFTFEDKYLNPLKKIAPLISKVLPSGIRFYRARISYKRKLTKWRTDWNHYEIVFRPYQKQDINAPPPPITLGGRMNRPGVSFLYLAEDEKTAIAEIRPHTGQHVSIGTFEARRDIKIVDLVELDFKLFCLKDELIDQFVFLKNVNKSFSMPILPGLSHRYSVTQFLSDIFRKLGFEGIIYESSLTQMKNIVVFDPNTFKYCDESGKVFLINKVEYTYLPENYESKPDSYPETSYYKI